MDFGFTHTLTPSLMESHLPSDTTWRARLNVPKIAATKNVTLTSLFCHRTRISVIPSRAKSV